MSIFPVFHCSTKKNSTMINFSSRFIQLPLYIHPIGHFRVAFRPFDFHLQVHFYGNQTQFCTKTRFETEAQRNIHPWAGSQESLIRCRFLNLQSMFTMSDSMSDDIVIPSDMVNIFWATTTREVLLSLLIAADTLMILNYKISRLYLIIISIDCYK